MPLINQAVQIGRGVDGAINGQQFDVYRLGPTTSNGVVTGNPLYAGYPASMKRASKADIENFSFELQIFEGQCDSLALTTGDVLVESPAYYQGTGSMYVFAQHRPLAPNLFVRCEYSISITRPSPQGGQAGQQPVSGMIAQSPYTGYGGVTKASAQLCTLTNGLFGFSSAGSLASIPCQIQPQNRVTGIHSRDLPTAFPETRFSAYVPLLPGVQVQENDELNLPNGDRYSVLQPYSSGEVGLVGYILLLRKLAV